jgi:hypothetical protein
MSPLPPVSSSPWLPPLFSSRLLAAHVPLAAAEKSGVALILPNTVHLEYSYRFQPTDHQGAKPYRRKSRGVLQVALGAPSSGHSYGDCFAEAMLESPTKCRIARSTTSPRSKAAGVRRARDLQITLVVLCSFIMLVQLVVLIWFGVFHFTSKRQALSATSTRFARSRPGSQSQPEESVFRTDAIPQQENQGGVHVNDNSQAGAQTAFAEEAPYREGTRPCATHSETIECQVIPPNRSPDGLPQRKSTNSKGTEDGVMAGGGGRRSHDSQSSSGRRVSLEGLGRRVKEVHARTIQFVTEKGDSPSKPSRGQRRWQMKLEEGPERTVKPPTPS